MGIDLNHKNLRLIKRREPVSEDPYIRLLVKLYRFLARRTDSNFNKVVLKRLFMARRHRPPVSISKLMRFPIYIYIYIYIYVCVCVCVYIYTWYM